MREREREGGAVVQEVREGGGGGKMRIPDSSAVGG